MRDKAHYLDMLDRNPTATVGVSLAVKMVYAATVEPPQTDREERDDRGTMRRIWETLHAKYGETLTAEQARHEMTTMTEP